MHDVSLVDYCNFVCVFFKSSSQSCGVLSYRKYNPLVFVYIYVYIPSPLQSKALLLEHRSTYMTRIGNVQSVHI